MTEYTGGRPAKKVAQVDIETGEVIEVYENAHDAAYDNYVDVANLYRALRESFGVIKSKNICFKYMD